LLIDQSDVIIGTCALSFGGSIKDINVRCARHPLTPTRYVWTPARPPHRTSYSPLLARGVASCDPEPQID
jgi:hypothetical protein